MAEWNERKEAFCREYIIDFNATQSAIRAGYSKKTAGAIGSRLLKDVEVQAEIKRLIEQRSERTGVTADRVVEQLAKIAFVDIKSIIDWETAEINEFVGNDPITKERIFTKLPITKLALKPMDQVDGSLIQTVKMGKHGIVVELPDRMRAFEMLAKHLGVYDDRPQTSVDVGSYVKALWERAGAGDMWKDFDNGGPVQGDDGDGEG